MTMFEEKIKNIIGEYIFEEYNQDMIEETNNFINPLLYAILTAHEEEMKKERERVVEKIEEWSKNKQIQTGGDLSDKLSLAKQAGESFAMTDLQIYLHTLKAEESKV